MNFMIYITGDTHRDFTRILFLTYQNKTTIDDIIIILGDAGINFCDKATDDSLKKQLSQEPITFFCIHGNHEKRPQTINTYKEKQFKGGTVYYEEAYPNLLFAKDGEIYNFNNKKVLVIGGAYSVDKEYRQALGYGWWEDEQPSQEIKDRILETIKNNNNKVDIVLSHTCPYKYLPYEVFIPGIDQSTVDQSTEKFLDDIENTLNYKKWYCGHYHTEKLVDKLEFLFESVKEFDK